LLYGEKLPFKLQQARFKNITFDVKTWRSSFELTDENLVDLFSDYGAFSLQVAPDVFSKNDYDELMDGGFKHEVQHDDEIVVK